MASRHQIEDEYADFDIDEKYFNNLLTFEPAV
jgi:hypothetical protein